MRKMNKKKLNNNSYKKKKILKKPKISNKKLLNYNDNWMKKIFNYSCQKKVMQRFNKKKIKNKKIQKIRF